MDWQERTERQVGARGIDELRQWIAVSASADAAARPVSTHLASLLVIVCAVALALVLGPSSSAGAEPLSPGSYSIPVAGGVVTITVVDGEAPRLHASDGLVVRLSFDAQGRVLDEFTVLTADGPVSVELDAGRGPTDGPTVTTARVPDELVATDGLDALAAVTGASDTRATIVRTVAACTPRGAHAEAVGWPNHGTVLSAAASGLPLEVPGAATGTPVRAELTTLADAETFCALADSLGEAPAEDQLPQDTPGTQSGAAVGPASDSPRTGSSATHPRDDRGVRAEDAAPPEQRQEPAAGAPADSDHEPPPDGQPEGDQPGGVTTPQPDAATGDHTDDQQGQGVDDEHPPATDGGPPPERLPERPGRSSDAGRSPTSGDAADTRGAEGVAD